MDRTGGGEGKKVGDGRMGKGVQWWVERTGGGEGQEVGGGKQGKGVE